KLFAEIRFAHDALLASKLGKKVSTNLGAIQFKDGEPGSNQAISARETLGPKWAVIVKDGVNLCN
ncbi:hypothetical protein ACIQUH_21270, partial [Agrobacterium sp. NPDC090283]